jgi:hypothetical protein
MATKAPLTLAIKAPLTLATKAPLTLATLATRGAELVANIDKALGTNWRQTFVHVTFGAFVGGLALLLILLYAGVPIVGS